jgi:hypothetical protein
MKTWRVGLQSNEEFMHTSADIFTPLKGRGKLAPQHQMFSLGEEPWGVQRTLSV